MEEGRLPQGSWVPGKLVPQNFSSQTCQTFSHHLLTQSEYIELKIKAVSVFSVSKLLVSSVGTL